MEHSLENQNMSETQKLSRIRGPKGTNRLTPITAQITGNPYLPGTTQHAVFEAMPKPSCTLEAFFEALIPCGLKAHGSKMLKQAARRGYVKVGEAVEAG